MSENVNVFAPPPALYTNVNGPPLTIAAEPLQQLQRLADDASEPGAAVSPSDLVNEALADYLGNQKKKLAKIVEADEEAALVELERVHGSAA